jgi:Leucine-rich repeat (LRR) protein
VLPPEKGVGSEANGGFPDTEPLRRIRTTTDTESQRCLLLKTASPTDLEIDRGDTTTGVIHATTTQTSFCHQYPAVGKWKITLQNPEQLTALNLAKQQISAFQGGEATALTNLNLSNNTLKTLTSTSFKSFPHLEILYLQENEIREIEPGTFDTLQKLSYLDISRNQIKALKA